jgi:hypothetical protein
MHIAEIASLIVVTSAQTSSIAGRSFGASIEHETKLNKLNNAA